MAELIFYEKPGCVGNQRQQAMLRAHGITFQVKDLLGEPWTGETLRPFFGQQPVATWFNASAPSIKSGAIDPYMLSETQALALMCLQPILIARPLLQYGDYRQSGFTNGPVLAACGLHLAETQDLQTCPMGEPFSRECAP